MGCILASYFTENGSVFCKFLNIAAFFSMRYRNGTIAHLHITDPKILTHSYIIIKLVAN